MSSQAEMKSLLRATTEPVNQILALLDGVSDEDINWRPGVPESDSLHGIAMHVIGGVLARVAGAIDQQPFDRDREAELASSGLSKTQIRERWREVMRRTEAAFANAPEGTLDRTVNHPAFGEISLRDNLLVMARHGAEHFGEAQLIVGLLKQARGG